MQPCGPALPEFRAERRTSWTEPRMPTVTRALRKASGTIANPGCRAVPWRGNSTPAIGDLGRPARADAEDACGKAAGRRRESPGGLNDRESRVQIGRPSASAPCRRRSRPRTLAPPRRPGTPGVGRPSSPYSQSRQRERFAGMIAAMTSTMARRRVPLALVGRSTKRQEDRRSHGAPIPPVRGAEAGSV